MVFTPQQIEELLTVLDKYTTTFIAQKVGTNILTRKDLDLLRSSGIDLTKIPVGASNVSHAFKFGLLSDAVGNDVAKKMSYDQFKTYLSSGKFIPLNTVEEAALQNLKIQTYSDVKRLGNRMSDEMRHEFVMANKKAHTIKHSKTVTDAAKRAIEHRQGVSHIVSELGHLTKRWDRDLGRIGDYVLHTAFDEGRASSFERRDGDNALVYKDVYPGACAHCQKAYLEGGVGSEPKIFKLSDLKANGTNIGRKVTEYLPVIGPLHPWCRCTLERVPFGFTLTDYRSGLWEWNGSMFVRKETRKPKVEREKVKVTVNGKESYV